MPITITYFVHSTTTDNEANLASGWNEVQLSALGLEQAHSLREDIKDMQFDVVFCSDLGRAVHTAEIAFCDKAPIIQDKRLRECNYGIYESQPCEIVDPIGVQSIETPFPEGESYEEVKARIADFLAMLKKDYDGKSVAVIAHKAPQLALDVLLKGKTWEEAFAEDWRKTKSWQPGWGYIID